MVSTTMHLAVANKMKEYNIIGNFKRYELGQILPDAITRGLESHADSHFKVTVCDGAKKMIDFAAFRDEFLAEIKTDDLYLGYYFHLIQDGIFRRFLYYDYHYQVRCREDVEALHNDYRLLNTYLVSKYHLEDNLEIPQGFEQEKIHNVYPFSIYNYREKIRKDYIPYRNGKIQFFTEEMADEYIIKCSEI